MKNVVNRKDIKRKFNTIESIKSAKSYILCIKPNKIQQIKIKRATIFSVKLKKNWELIRMPIPRNILPIH